MSYVLPESGEHRPHVISYRPRYRSPSAELLSLLNRCEPVVDTVVQMFDIGAVSGFPEAVTELVGQIQVLDFQKSSIDIIV